MGADLCAIRCSISPVDFLGGIASLDGHVSRVVEGFPRF